ncbi:Arginine--pyruvate transaminase AruH [Platysternon megacephalum]|uniref:Arginine--pyruvate transaminase AruH n=1 Tax=Platysternon megacephalum TaxID=55544 RepID=A0A4D9DBT5_9SAUR|nr:Arginine--pyruvate transaminase AruH [Platysternon megacephalum]
MWNEPFFITFMGMAAAAQVEGFSVPLKDTGEEFVFDVDAIDAYLSANPGGIWILNSPHNPTGALVDDDQWPHILQIAERTDTVIVFDDAYRDFNFDGLVAPYRTLLESGRVIVCGSISKTLAASGLRVGWMLVPPALRGAADDFHAALTYCVPAFVQKATVDVLAAVRGERMAQTCATYADRVDKLCSTLASVGADIRRPRGGFFLVAALPTNLTDTFDHGMDLVRHLAQTHRISPLPMDQAFSKPTPVRWLRWTTSLTDADLDEGCRRILAM